MNDQAMELREMMRGAATALDEGAPALVAVTGGKGGVGTTTIALQVALGLVREGWRTALIDADLSGGDIATLCGIESRYGLSDVLSGERSVHEALSRGPAGLHVLAGAWQSRLTEEVPVGAVDRLVRQLRALRPHIDFVVIDTGNGASRTTSQLWNEADEVLLITSPDVMAITDAYATVKLLSAGARESSIVSVVNFTTQAHQGREVHMRLANACRRFLGLSLSFAGAVPGEPSIMEATALGQPLLISDAGTAASQAFAQLAEAVSVRAKAVPWSRAG